MDTMMMKKYRLNKKLIIANHSESVQIHSFLIQYSIGVYVSDKTLRSANLHLVDCALEANIQMVGSIKIEIIKIKAVSMDFNWSEGAFVINWITRASAANSSINNMR